VSRLAIEEVLTAPRSPWQNPYAERLIGSIRRECLNHVIVLNDRHLKRLLRSYFAYYHTARTHLAPEKQCPWGRPIQGPSQGNIFALPHLGGLHHEYRRAPDRGAKVPNPETKNDLGLLCRLPPMRH